MVYDGIKSLIDSLDTSRITEDRKRSLKPLIDYIQIKADDKQSISLNFICTHNSRRSHFAQVWAQTMASFFKMDNVSCYSGGTEVTALFPMVAKSLTNSGFQVKTISDGENPIYSINYSENQHPIIGFSKTFDNDFNPQSEFAAILTCSQADEGCPFIAGAEQRIPVTFEDPKAFDKSPQQEEKYMERSLQIASELKYVFEKIS